MVLALAFYHPLRPTSAVNETGALDLLTIFVRREKVSRFRTEDCSVTGAGIPLLHAPRDSRPGRRRTVVNRWVRRLCSPHFKSFALSLGLCKKPPAYKGAESPNAALSTG